MIIRVRELESAKYGQYFMTIWSADVQKNAPTKIDVGESDDNEICARVNFICDSVRRLGNRLTDHIN